MHFRESDDEGESTVLEFICREQVQFNMYIRVGTGQFFHDPSGPVGSKS
jgi:hypothetical protein